MVREVDIPAITKSQLACDFNCINNDFGTKSAVFNTNALRPGRRIYKSDGCLLKIVSYLGTAAFMADHVLLSWLKDRFEKVDAAWIFQYQQLKEIDKKLFEYGHEIADVHHYYLPKKEVEVKESSFEIKWYSQEEILEFKSENPFHEAFAFDEKHPDILGVAAINEGIIIGMAGASSDSETMWQIGIDVIPEFRGKGVASLLTTLLKNRILELGKVPFYGTVESHHLSKMVAINAGFYPAWAELYSKPIEK